LECALVRNLRLTAGSLVVSLGLLGCATGQWRYYDGTLYMLGLLHVARAFKLYY